MAGWVDMALPPLQCRGHSSGFLNTWHMPRLPNTRPKPQTTVPHKDMRGVNGQQLDLAMHLAMCACSKILNPEPTNPEPRNPELTTSEPT